MVRSRQAALFAAFLLSAACLLAQTPEPKPGAITLTFVDSVTKIPIKGAKVAIRNVDGAGPGVSKATGDSGEAEFTDLEPGRYFFSSVTATGYIFGLLQQRAAMVLRSGDRLKFGPFEIQPNGVVSGTVLDAEDKPIARATVDVLNLASISPLGARSVGTTDAEGHYRIEGIAPGRVQIRVLGNAQLGVATVYYPNGSDAAQALKVEVPAGREVTRIDFHVRRERMFHIRGTVERVEGGGSKIGFSTTPCADLSNADILLRKALTARPDGSFDAEVVAGDYCIVYTLGSDLRMTHFARAVVRVADRDIDGVHIVPTAPKELTGTVKLEKDAGLSMPPSVSLLPSDPYLPQPEPGQVQADGSFRIAAVFPVGYGLFMTDGGGYVQSITLGGTAIVDGRLNLESNGGPLLIGIAAARGLARVKVNLGSVKPAQTMVVLMPASSAGFRTDLWKIRAANDQGEALFSALAPGLYKAYAFADPDRERLNAANFLELFPSSTVRIANGEEPNIELRLIPRREFDDAKARF